MIVPYKLWLTFLIGFLGLSGVSFLFLTSPQNDASATIPFRTSEIQINQDRLDVAFILMKHKVATPVPYGFVSVEDYANWIASQYQLIDLGPLHPIP